MSGMADRLRIGMLTPSSNTVLEPIAVKMLHGLDGVSVHFSRVRVTEVSLSARSKGQFELDAILAAAELLADARVHVMGWNATSASWRGFDGDRRLCSTLTERFGTPATTAVLAVNELLRLFGATRFALVTPYLQAIQERIIDNYARDGFQCVAERHLGESVNYAFGEVEEQTVAEMVRAVAAEDPDAIVIMCTNLKGAQVAVDLEAEIRIPVFDSVSAFVRQALLMGNIDPRRVVGWGRLFERG